MSEINPDYSEIFDSGLFLADWYLEQYQDVAAAGQDPLEHYLSYGAAEGRDPGPEFSTSGYLARYQDVVAAGINPLLHYIRNGRQEGRITSPCLDPGDIKRPYWNFGEYLTYSMLNPLVKAPFATVDNSCFALMEHVAQWLCHNMEEDEYLPLVSVIMPMRDRAAVVADAIRSALAQSYSNFELIVVDDGSRDDSVSVVRDFNDSRIRLIESSHSGGVSAARNRGLAVARGDLIAYLDSDNTWRPDYLRAMAGAFQVRPGTDAAYCGQNLYRGNEREPFAVRFGCYNPALLCNRNYIDLNCFVHRRDVLETIGGGFCEEIKRWVDWEFILRISRKGRIISVPIIQSNYFLDKADNTITATQELQPAREYIMGKQGYGGQGGSQQYGDQLAGKVVVVMPGREGVGNAISFDSPNITGYIQSMKNEGMKNARVKTIIADPGCGRYQALNKAVQVADPDSDILILDRNAVLTPGALPALQKAAYACDSIAITVPQQVLAGGEAAINTHVPYAFNDVPCDVSLSLHYRNVEAVSLFHGGGPLDLNFTSFFCVYIKRDVWELCGGFDDRQGRDEQSDGIMAERIMCDFVRHVLGKRIVYTPDAVVLNRDQTALEKGAQ